MTTGRLISILLVLLIAAALYAVVNRYAVTIGGGSRYYSVIKLDRWTGQTWRLDNSGRQWNRIEQPAP